MLSFIPKDYFEVKKNGVSPFQTMVAYLGGSAFQTVVDNPVTLVQLGDLSDPLVLLGCATFIAIIVLDKMNIKEKLAIKAKDVEKIEKIKPHKKQKNAEDFKPQKKEPEIFEQEETNDEDQPLVENISKENCNIKLVKIKLKKPYDRNLYNLL